MKTRLIIAGLGNLIDTLSTVYLHRLGYVEANPVMALLLSHPLLFILVKMAVFTALLLWLWHRREDRHAKPLAALAAIVYGAIAVYYGLFFVCLI